MKNFTLKELCLFITLTLSFVYIINAQESAARPPASPEIAVLGNGNSISDNDVTPSTTDFTDFQTNLTRTFTIDNIQSSGNTTLTVTSITLSNTTDFTISSPLADNTITKNQTPEPFTITFNNPGAGTYTSTVTIASDAGNDGGDNVWVYTIQATGVTPAPEIDITGNGNSIVSGDITPSTTDDTDFGNVEVGFNSVHTFTIDNSGTAVLNIGTITFTGTNPGDYAITNAPAATVASGGGSTTFDVTFTAGALGNRTATINIVNDDADEALYTFDLIGNGIPPQPEMNITGNGVSIVDGDTTPSATDDTVFGSTGPGTPISHTFTIENSGSATLNVGAISFSGANPGDFSVSTAPSATVAGSGGSTTFIVDFDPTANGTRSAIISIVNDDADENPYDFTIQGTGVVPLTEGPGGVTADLALWLKGTDGLGYTDGQSVSTWADQGRGADATVNTAGQEPTFKDNVTDNVNFNPVVDFDNLTDEFDNSFDYTDTNQQFLEGTSGYYTDDMFMVVIPDLTVDSTFGSMDLLCSDHDTATQENDGSGIGFGAYSQRFSGEVICYAYAMSSGVDNGFGVSQNEDGSAFSYDNVGIINSRHNTSSGPTTQELYYNATNLVNNTSDIASFGTIADEKYWIGRSEGWRGSTDARIAEVITYSARKTDTDLTVERNRIMSYLAIKYGITLGDNGTSQDYVDSDGTVIWDVDTGVPANDVFNYDIAGIGRDDDSELHQKQSRSVNNAVDGTRAQGVLTMGISSIYDTNNLNPSTDLNDKEFLVWGNDGVDLDDPAVVVDIDMSSAITPAIPGGTFVQFNGIARTWKVVENGGDIPSVEIAILNSAVRTATPPDGVYLMFISDSPNFGPTADFREMTADTNELGEAILKTNYDFDGTKYITFGWAPERVYTRSVYFDGSGDYIDMEDALDLNPTAFTISAWINRDITDTGIKSIVSKRDVAFTTGYDFRILNSNRVLFTWYAPGVNNLVSNTSIPKGEWHHLAVTFDGTTASIYIDGVLDNSIAGSQPIDTNESFYIGAAGKNAPTQHFGGNIDEVRVWDANLTESQLRFIMNQEIEENSNFVNGSYFMDRSITPTKNDIASIPWTDLAGYYPMSTYTYTNTKDESGNGNRGALRNLRTVDKQTAPLPYLSTADGDWDTQATWENGSMQTIPGTRSIVDNTVTIDWNIVETNHNITMDNSALPASNNDSRNILALAIESNEVELSGDNASNTGNALIISHFLSIDGKLDLEGDSQLIQTTDSDFDATSAGTLEKDQQGTQDLYTYNYWSSPVGASNITTNNNSYTLNNNIFKDGSDSSSPQNMNFITGYDGSNGDPIGIAHYWIWKFANHPSLDYSSWEHIRNTGSILAGEGFTMKGVNDTSGAVSIEQNYTIEGKPNNGDITLSITAGNDYLIGNPYASALDSNSFILDNTNTTGAIYYWEHFGGGTHITEGYEGGYAIYNLSGGVKAIQYDFDTGGTDPSGGTGSKTPGRYIPVAQGFFVIGTTTGNLNFNNDQRIFKTEDLTSVFLRESSSVTSHSSEEEVDDRLKIRLSFETSSTYNRQILVTQDESATNEIDFGYDAENKDESIDDMYWMISNEKFVIQGTNSIEESTILPIGIKTSENGINTFKIDELINFPEDLNIYLHDKDSNTYHNLRNDLVQIELDAGEYLERFEITFTNQSLSIDDFTNNEIDVYYSNDSNSIVINNPKNIQIDSAQIINMIGQSVYKYDNIDPNSEIKLETKNISTGSYIIKLDTEIGEISKKVLAKL